MNFHALVTLSKRSSEVAMRPLILTPYPIHLPATQKRQPERLLVFQNNRNPCYNTNSEFPFPTALPFLAQTLNAWVAPPNAYTYHLSLPLNLTFQHNTKELLYSDCTEAVKGLKS